MDETPFLPPGFSERIVIKPSHFSAKMNRNGGRMTKLDEAEYQRLQAEIAETEKLLGSDPRITRSSVEKIAHPLRQRASHLEKDDYVQEKRKQSKGMVAVAIAQLVALESNLSHSERQSYADFLRQDFFSNADIPKLENFYEDGGPFDRLTKKGKDEMTIRMVEGIERGALDVNKLSPSLLDKHLGHLHTMMKEDQLHPRIAEIPEDKREAFIREFESGDRVKAQEVLSGTASFYSLEESKPASERSIEAGPENAELAPAASQAKEVAVQNNNLSDASFFESLETAPKNATDLPVPPGSSPQKGS